MREKKSMKIIVILPSFSVLCMSLGYSTFVKNNTSRKYMAALKISNSSAIFLCKKALLRNANGNETRNEIVKKSDNLPSGSFLYLLIKYNIIMPPITPPTKESPPIFAEKNERNKFCPCGCSKRYTRREERRLTQITANATSKACSAETFLRIKT